MPDEDRGQYRIPWAHGQVGRQEKNLRSMDQFSTAQTEFFEGLNEDLLLLLPGLVTAHKLGFKPLPHEDNRASRCHLFVSGCLSKGRSSRGSLTRWLAGSKRAMSGTIANVQACVLVDFL
ncbi:hypothetical protein ABBQ38_004220 [Trebouxia sp. C0009 RCD-2024]